MTHPAPSDDVDAGARALAPVPRARDPVGDTLRRLLNEHPGSGIQDIMRRLRTDPSGLRVSRRQVESVLQDDQRFVREEILGRSSWHVDDAAETDGPPEGIGSPSRVPSQARSSERAHRPLDGLALRDWQIDAFAAWAQAGCRGVIEAVTGTGKTRVGLAATRAALTRGGRVLVLVPTIDLMHQWRRRLREHVPGVRVGRLGGGGDDDLHECHVVIATPHSAASVPISPPPGTVGLLVADEAHRYGAPTWAEALRPTFAMRMALTATYERNDDGLAEVLGPYFGGIVASYGYEEAARDGTIAPFSVAFVGTDLEGDERSRYDLADEKLKRHRRQLLQQGVSPEPRALIAAASEIVARAQGRPHSGVDPATIAARGFLSALRTRRDIAATCAGKLQVLGDLAPALRGHRALVFTDTVEQAQQSARLLSGAGLPAEELHGDLSERERRIRLARFGQGSLSVLSAPRVLDEGIDVPEADVAVVLSAFRTRRQMIQRLGRVLRVKPDGRRAHLLVVYAVDTREDPSDGAHSDFLDEILPVAEEVRRIHGDRDRELLRRWIIAPPAV